MTRQGISLPKRLGTEVLLLIVIIAFIAEEFSEIKLVLRVKLFDDEACYTCDVQKEVLKKLKPKKILMSVMDILFLRLFSCCVRV